MFKKVKFNVANKDCIYTMENKNISLEEAIKILKDPNVINFTAIKVTNGEYLREINRINSK